MPSLKEIKRRISSIESTKQITRAMKMVAAARLKKAQDNMMHSRPYSDRLKTVIQDLAARASSDAHPLLQEREPKDVGIVIITSDRGLAGSFNSNVCRQAERIIAEEQAKPETRVVKLIAIGKKGYEYFKNRGGDIIEYHEGLMKDFNFGVAADIGTSLRKMFEYGFVKDEGLDRIVLVYNEFKSVIQQDIVVDQLFPIVPEMAEDEKYPVDFIYEPSETEVLDHVLGMYANVVLWRALLESFASELSARMTAMENATTAAGELIDSLTLEYNKARQAAITTEILEVVSGAEALK